MSQIIRTYALGNMSDLTAISSTQSTVYKLGDKMVVYDDTLKVSNVYMYVKSSGGCAQYGVYAITFSGTAGAEVLASAVASSAVYGLYCVAPVAITDAYFGWVQIKGSCTAKSTGNTTISHFGKAINAAATATDESSRGTNSVLVWKATQSAGAANVAAYLLGERALVA